MLRQCSTCRHCPLSVWFLCVKTARLPLPFSEHEDEILRVSHADEYRRKRQEIEERLAWEEDYSGSGSWGGDSEWDDPSERKFDHFSPDEDGSSAEEAHGGVSESRGGVASVKCVGERASSSASPRTVLDRGAAQHRGIGSTPMAEVRESRDIDPDSSWKWPTDRDRKAPVSKCRSVVFPTWR